MPGPTIVTKWGLEPSEAETAAAAGELPESAGGWTHLLAEAAGLLPGFHEGGPGAPQARAAAGFCIAAGADQDVIPQWTEEARRRAEAARMPPLSRSGGTPPEPWA
jgi:hypothetical protein